MSSFTQRVVLNKQDFHSSTHFCIHMDGLNVCTTSSKKKKRKSPHLLKLTFSDEFTSLLNLIQLFKFIQRGVCLHCYVHHTLNYRFRAAAECISHCCVENTQQCLHINCGSAYHLVGKQQANENISIISDTINS